MIEKIYFWAKWTGKVEVNLNYERKKMKRRKKKKKK